MRRLCLTVLLLSLAVAAPATAQKPTDEKPDKAPVKGDEIVVRGCISGSMLQSFDTRRTDDAGKLTGAITYRLIGPRQVLRTLRNDHDKHLENVTGILKSDLPDDARGERGKRIGNTRVFIGIGAPGQRGNSPGDAMSHMPVLEVISFEHVAGSCG